MQLVDKEGKLSFHPENSFERVFEIIHATLTCHLSTNNNLACKKIATDFGVPVAQEVEWVVLVTRRLLVRFLAPLSVEVSLSKSPHSDCCVTSGV